MVKTLPFARPFTANETLFPSLVRPVPLLGGPQPAVRPPGAVLGSLLGDPPLRLLAGLEGAGHHAHQPGVDLHLQDQPGPLQVGRQPRGGRGRGGLGVRGGHKPERGGGEAGRRHCVPAGPGGVEGVPVGGAGVRGMRRGNGQVLTRRWGGDG